MAQHFSYQKLSELSDTPIADLKPCTVPLKWWFLLSQISCFYKCTAFSVYSAFIQSAVQFASQAHLTIEIQCLSLSLLMWQIQCKQHRVYREIFSLHNTCLMLDTEGTQSCLPSKYSYGCLMTFKVITNSNIIRLDRLNWKIKQNT